MSSPAREPSRRVSSAEQALLGSVGHNIRQLRRRRRMTQQELSQITGLTRTYIGGIERGARNPSLVTLHRMADALGTEAGRLVPVAESTVAKQAPRRPA